MNFGIAAKLVPLFVAVSALVAPVASAQTENAPVQVDGCVAMQCVHTQTNTITNTQTCTSSGWFFIIVGNDNDFNVCQQDQNNGTESW